MDTAEYNMNSMIMRIMKNMFYVLVILCLGFSFCQSSSPASNVYHALSSLCTDQYRGSSCPYMIAYDIATQIFNQWQQGDGGSGLWSNGNSSIWWQSGIGLWTLAEFLHTMNGTGK